MFGMASVLDCSDVAMINASDGSIHAPVLYVKVFASILEILELEFFAYIRTEF